MFANSGYTSIDSSLGALSPAMAALSVLGGHVDTLRVGGVAVWRKPSSFGDGSVSSIYRVLVLGAATSVNEDKNSVDNPGSSSASVEVKVDAGSASGSTNNTVSDNKSGFDAEELTFQDPSIKYVRVLLLPPDKEEASKEEHSLVVHTVLRQELLPSPELASPCMLLPADFRPLWDLVRTMLGCAVERRGLTSERPHGGSQTLG